MKKQIMGILLSALLLTGCGSDPADPGAGKPEQSDPTPTKAVSEAQATEAPAPSLPDAEPDDSGVFSKFFENGEVEGNGGYFIRVGRKVYYREFLPEAFPEFATFAEYLSCVDGGVASKLHIYDLDSLKDESLLDCYGEGPIFAGTEGLFFGDARNDTTWLVRPDSGDIKSYCSGSPIAISADGRQLAVMRWDGSNLTYDVLEGGELLYEIDFEENKELYGFCGSDLILRRELKDGSHELLSFDKNGNSTPLGTLPEKSVETSYPFPEVIQFLPDSHGCFICLGYYEGTGHFLSEWFVVSVRPGEAGSLTTLQHSGDTEYPPTMFMEGDQPAVYQTFNKSIELSNGTYGDLIWHDSPRGVTVLEKDFISDLDYFSEDDPLYWSENIQNAVVLDKTAFVIRARGEHFEEMDIGWRPAYIPYYYEYRVIPFGEEMRDDEGNPDQIHNLCTHYIEPAEIDTELLRGRWEETAYITEGSHGYVMEDLKEYLEFHEDGSITLEMKDSDTNRYKEYTLEESVIEYGDPCYTTEVGSWGTYTFTLYRRIEDRLEVSVMWHYSDGTPGSSTHIYRKMEE